MSEPRFYFNPHAKGIEVFLGPTEARLMTLAWKRKSLTVKQALFLWPESPRPAYTTVMTVLARLHQKGFLRRAKEGRSFVYEPVVDRKSFLKERTAIVRDCLSKNF